MKKKKPTISKKHVGITIFLFIMAALFYSGGWNIVTHYSSLYWSLADALAASLALDIHTSTLTEVMSFFSWWGLYGTLAVTAGVAVLMTRKRYWIIVAMIGLLSLTGVVFEFGIKHLIDRERPVDYSLVQLVTPSLPSGHALTATILYISLSYFYYRFFRKFWVSVLVFFLSLILILAVSFSRIYLGVHYFSDVAAGVLFGIGSVALVLGLERLYWVFVLGRRNKQRA